MADWKVTTPDAWQAECVQKLGREEFDRRLAVANAKVEQFPKRLWKEQMFYGQQFRAVAMQLNADQFRTLEGWDYRRWMALVNRAAGV